MQIEPQVTLPLVYNLVNPFDSTTYFVRAVIVDSLTGTTIATKNLSSQGNGRYTSSISAPQDPTGFGRHIDVVISVYTDSGYTAYSRSYERRIDKYLIRAVTKTFGGGGGTDVDYEKIRTMLSGFVKTLSERLDIVLEKIPHATDLSSVYQGIEALKKLIEAIDIPEYTPEKLDLTPALDSVNKLGVILSGKMEGMKPKEQDPVDLSPITNAIERLSISLGVISKKVDGKPKEVVKEIIREVPATQNQPEKTSVPQPAPEKNILSPFIPKEVSIEKYL